MVRFFIKNLKFFVIVGLVLAFAGYSGYIYYKGGKTKALEIEIATTETAMEVQEKKDEIRNNRPDINALINSLQQGSF